MTGGLYQADTERKDRSLFSRLPQDLRDRVIAALDDGQTLDQALETIRSAGIDTSRSALSAAYSKLRRTRRRSELAGELSQLIREFRARPGLEGFQALANLLAARASEALADEEGGVDAIGATAKALQAMTQLSRLELERARLQMEAERAKKGSKPAAQSLDDILAEHYGIRRGKSEPATAEG